MKPILRPTLAAVLIVLAASAAVHAEQALPSIGVEVGQLKCGDALLTAEAKFRVVPETRIEYVSQVLRLNNDKKGISKVLPLDGKPIKQDFAKDGPVLDAYVTSWTCLASTTGKSYLYLSYYCPENKKRPKCAGVNREWAQLFDTDGTNLSAGHRRNGPQYIQLMKRLGLESYLREGIKLRGVADSPQAH